MNELNETDERPAFQPLSLTLSEIANALGARCVGDPAMRLHGVNGLSEAAAGEVSFFTNLHYRDKLAATEASAVILSEEALKLFEPKVAEGKGAIVAEDPYLAFAMTSALFHPPRRFLPGIDHRAVVDEGARVSEKAVVMAMAYVGKEAVIEEGAVIYPFAYIGEDVRIGRGAIIYPGVIVREGCSVGEGSILQPGVSIGGDGFGFAFDKKGHRHFKIPQAGVVHIGRDVEIGANSAIDRATNGVTSIGDGTKIDNLVQIGHNVTVGPLSILCGQVGIAGSSTLGQGVVCGGQAGLGNLVHICDGARIGPKGGVMSDVTEPGDYLGAPLVKSRDFMRQQVALHKAPDLMKTVSRLEKQVASLESKLQEMSAALEAAAPKKDT